MLKILEEEVEYIIMLEEEAEEEILAEGGHNQKTFSKRKIQ